MNDELSGSGKGQCAGYCTPMGHSSEYYEEDLYDICRGYDLSRIFDQMSSCCGISYGCLTGIGGKARGDMWASALSDDQWIAPAVDDTGYLVDYTRVLSIHEAIFGHEINEVGYFFFTQQDAEAFVAIAVLTDESLSDV
jgi:hypothetical protein